MTTAIDVYNTVSKYYFLGPIAFFGPYFFVDAPFGRFSPSKSSRLLVDGIKSWMVMEIVSPISFLATFLSSPLTRPLSSFKRFLLSPPPIYTQLSLTSKLHLSVPNAPTVLALLFLIHYANRAIASPLRTPLRSKSHISVPLSAVIFNVVNGSLMGGFLAAVATPIPKMGHGLGAVTSTSSNWQFWAGIAIWTIGFASNIWHDEILLDIRRKPQIKAAKDNKKGDDKPGNKPHYEIPYGGLYSLISYPNYFSEWVEWFGFAVAASALTAQLPASHVVFPFAAGRLNLGAFSDIAVVQQLTPAWLFLSAEIFLMLPRAWNGHKWYQKTFPHYPRERRAVIPFLV